MKLFKITLLYTLLIFFSCKENPEPKEKNISTSSGPIKEAMLSKKQFDALDIQIDTLANRLMSGFVKANGQLEIPPQSEASVTPVIGGNITDIRVIEGDEVKKGQVLGYIEHPDIIKVQSQYINVVNQLKFQEKEFDRQKKLYEAGVGSGETFQRSEAELENLKGQKTGLKAQLKQLNVIPAKVGNGNIQRRIAVLSPIDGAVETVHVKTGQFVQAQTSMFEIINTHHVHVDLMVFEKDLAKVHQGQKVYFSVESLPGKELTAEILSVSKIFEQDQKALHVHAEIHNKPQNLVPGMYVRGRIAVDNNLSPALPQDAIARDGDRFFVFVAEEEGDAWSFRPRRIQPGMEEGGWLTVQFLEEVSDTARIAYNQAYYLMAEMNKGQGGHSH